MSRRLPTLLTLVLSLAAVQLGVPVVAATTAAAVQEEGGHEELCASEEGAPLRVSARRTTRLAALAHRHLPPPAADAALPFEQLQVVALPRFRDVRHLVPRYGE